MKPNKFLVGDKKKPLTNKNPDYEEILSHWINVNIGNY